MNMEKKQLVRCSCGEVVGEYYLDRIDDRLKAFGIDGGRVYKIKYNGKEARQPDGRIVPLLIGSGCLCKKCYKKGKG